MDTSFDLAMKALAPAMALDPIGEDEYRQEGRPCHGPRGGKERGVL